MSSHISCLYIVFLLSPIFLTPYLKILFWFPKWQAIFLFYCNFIQDILICIHYFFYITNIVYFHNPFLYISFFFLWFQYFGINPLAAFNRYGIRDILYWAIDVSVIWKKNFQGSICAHFPVILKIMLVISTQSNHILGKCHQICPKVQGSLQSFQHKGDVIAWNLSSVTGMVYYLALSLSTSDQLRKNSPILIF